MNIVMVSDNGKRQEFSINYEPILVSDDIKSCKFGINSENKLEEVKCSNNNSTILFRRNSSKLFMIKCIMRKNLVVYSLKLCVQENIKFA